MIVVSGRKSNNVTPSPPSLTPRGSKKYHVPPTVVATTRIAAVLPQSCPPTRPSLSKPRLPRVPRAGPLEFPPLHLRLTSRSLPRLMASALPPGLPPPPLARDTPASLLSPARHRTTKQTATSMLTPTLPNPLVPDPSHPRRRVPVVQTSSFSFLRHTKGMARSPATTLRTTGHTGLPVTRALLPPTSPRVVAVYRVSTKRTRRQPCTPPSSCCSLATRVLIAVPTRLAPRDRRAA